MPFQNAVNVQPVPGIPGDFASLNPRFSAMIGPGGLIAGPAGVTIGAFAWSTDTFIDSDGAPAIVNSFGSGPVTGFVPRNQQGLITTFLAETSNIIPSGFQMSLFTGGDFWIKNSGTTQALPGMFAYANYSNGLATFAAASSAATFTGTAANAATTGSFTGSIAGNVLTITAVTSGVAVPGGTISGTGVATGTQIVSQLSGTAGGIGTYALSIPEQTVASTTISETYGTLTVSVASTGTLGVGDVVTTGTAILGAAVTGLGTGTGGTGTYMLNSNATFASGAVVLATQAQTKWICMSSGLTGETVKITDHPQG
jgi:hypothetical protein